MSVIPFAAAFFARDLSVIACAVLGSLTTIGAMFLSIRAWRRLAAHTGSFVRIALSTVLVVAYCWLSLRVLESVRRFAKGPVAASNLSQIGRGLASYVERFGDHPPALIDLVHAGLATPKLFLSVGDPRIYESDFEIDPPNQNYHSSFVYQPVHRLRGDDSVVVIAYEREAWSPLSAALFPQFGRFTLFGDGSVRCLNDAELMAALDADRKRRETLPSVRELSRTSIAP